MTNSQNETSARCFSAILRRLLCTGSLPTHPSDHFTESNTTTPNQPHTKTLKSDPQIQAPLATPSIVARLMGLDSLPDINWAPKQTTLDSIPRSKSLNFIDCLPQFNQTQSAHHHQNVRTSASFREIPTFLRRENQDLLVLCFDKADEIIEEGTKVKKPDMGYTGYRELMKNHKVMGSNSQTKGQLPFRKKGELMVERSKNNLNMREKVLVEKKSCKRKEESKRVFVDGLGHKKDVSGKLSASCLKVKKAVKPMNIEEVCVGLKYSKQRKNQHAAKKVEPEVLHGFPIRLEAPMSEDSRVMGLNSGKKFSTKINKWEYPCPDFVPMSNADDQELRLSNIKAHKPMKSRETDYMNMLAEIWSLTEEDTKGSNWTNGDMINFEEICLEVGQQILELLLDQVVDELCGISDHYMMKNLAV